MISKRKHRAVHEQPAGKIFLQWDDQTCKLIGKKKTENRGTAIVFGMYKFWTIVGVYISFLLRINRFEKVIFLYTDEGLYDPHKYGSLCKSESYRKEILSYLDDLRMIQCVPVQKNINQYTINDEYREWIEEQSRYDASYICRKEKILIDKKDRLIYQHRVERNTAALFSFLALIENAAMPVVYMPNGRLMESGVIRRICQKRAIPYVTYESYGTDNRSMFLSKNKACIDLDISEIWEKIKEVPLTQEQNVWMEKLISNRHYPSRLIHPGKNYIDRQYHEVDIDAELSPHIKAFLAESGKTALLCGNVTWDSQALGKGIFYKTTVDWVLDTIQFFIDEHPEWKLIIRAHPDEKRWASEDRLSELIEFKLKSVRHRILIISSSEDVNTYRLISHANVALVWTSMIGCEIALRGVPVMTVADSHFRGKEFTIDTATQEEYKNQLTQAMNGNIGTLSIEETDLAKRYYYAFLNSISHDLGFIWRPDRWSYSYLATYPLENDSLFVKQLYELVI